MYTKFSLELHIFEIIRQILHNLYYIQIMLSSLFFEYFTCKFSTLPRGGKQTVMISCEKLANTAMHPLKKFKKYF